MRCLLLTMIAAGGILTACEGEELIGPGSIPRPETFVVFGIVHDQLGLPVSGASAQIVYVENAGGGAVPGRTAASNDSGYFSFTGIRGPITFRAWKDGYDFVMHHLLVESDVLVNVQLSKVDDDPAIMPGRTIRSTVNPGAPPCDPVRWDARAPCRRFTFTPPASGLLVITVWWNGGSPLDAIIMDPPDKYLAVSADTGFEEVTVEAFVTAGHKYEIRVNSYYDAQAFNLRADLRSPAAR